jgi:hypothetical protein
MNISTPRWYRVLGFEMEGGNVSPPMQVHKPWHVKVRQSFDKDSKGNQDEQRMAHAIFSFQWPH